MYIKSLELMNFRNYEKAFYEFSSGINIIYGQNGRGKTNLAEAIYLMSHSKSFRSRKDASMINFDSDAAYVKGVIETQNSEQIIDLRLGKNSPKAINLNSYPISKISDMIGVINVVSFTPEDIELVSEGPALRRGFLDREISQLYPAYYSLLTRYNSVLSNKNTLLKQEYIDPIMLDVYDDQLTPINQKIMTYRTKFIENLSEIAGKNHYLISGSKEKITMNYKSSFQNVNIIKKELKNSREHDIFKGYATKGIHRDELVIKLDEIDIREFGSQGQKKTAAISLKLATVEMIKQEKNDTPIVILDDIYSMLDFERRKLLTEGFGNLQVFITSTDKLEMDGANYIAI